MSNLGYESKFASMLGLFVFFGSAFRSMDLAGSFWNAASSEAFVDEVFPSMRLNRFRPVVLGLSLLSLLESTGILESVSVLVLVAGVWAC